MLEFLICSELRGSFVICKRTDLIQIPSGWSQACSKVNSHDEKVTPHRLSIQFIAFLHRSLFVYFIGAK